VKSNSFLPIVGDVTVLEVLKIMETTTKTNDNYNANASVSLDLLSLTFVTHTQRGPINLGALALETGCV